MYNPALFTPDPYITSTTRPSFVGKMFPSAHFYPRLLSILIRSGLDARKGRLSGDDWAMYSEDVTRCLENVGCRFVVEGASSWRELSGPCIFAGNHMSTLETMVLPAIIQPWREVTFVIKRSLFKYPLFKDVLSARKPIALDRVNPREDLKIVLEEGQRHLEAGTSLVVFPQSTRTPHFDATKFNSIAVKLAKRAGVPVVPLALLTRAWTEGKVLSDFGYIRPETIVRFRFGQPFTVQDQGREEQAALCSFIESTLRRWE